MIWKLLMIFVAAIGYLILTSEAQAGLFCHGGSCHVGGRSVDGAPAGAFVRGQPVRNVARGVGRLLGVRPAGQRVRRGNGGAFVRGQPVRNVVRGVGRLVGRRRR